VKYVAAIIAVLLLAGCGPAHIHIRAGEEPITWQGKYTGNMTIGPGGEVVVDFQGNPDMRPLPEPE